MQVQLLQSDKVLIGNVICGLIILGAIVNVIYFTFRFYNYHHHHHWKTFVRSEFFRINYTIEHLQWIKEYDQEDKKLLSEVKTRA